MDLSYYKYHFAQLHTARYKGKAAPHKAVLLLTIMRMIESGRISGPEIELTDELVGEYKAIWKEYEEAVSLFTCDICKPFFHMQHEPFWRLIGVDELVDNVAESLGLFSSDSKELPKGGYTINAIRRAFKCARIDEDLFNILVDEANRKNLIEIIENKYLCVR